MILCPQLEKHMSLGTRGKSSSDPIYHDSQFVFAISATPGSAELEVLDFKGRTLLPRNIMSVSLNYHYKCCLVTLAAYIQVIKSKKSNDYLW